MANDELVGILQSTQAFFEKTISCFQPQDAEFAPAPDMFTVAQHIAHAAQTVEWFFEGAFRPKGMNMDFAALEEESRAVRDLEDAMAWWRTAMQEARAALEGSAPEAWDEPIRGPLMAGLPRRSVLGGIADHCAHHRGALAVYARLCGREPPMPYG